MNLLVHTAKTFSIVSTAATHGPRSACCFSTVLATSEPAPMELALTCELCALQLPNAEAMHEHLTMTHHLASARWNPSRDTLDGQSSCAHCGQVFQSMESLRSHIAQSRCPHFDPSLTSEPKAVHSDWKAALCTGAFYDVMAVRQNRARLTLECQCCCFKYTRASDLALHLQSSHPAIWNASEKLTRLLTGMLYGLFGCVCHPRIAVQRISHVCLPVRQLAMQFCRLPDNALFFPFPVTELMLGKAYVQSLPRDLKFALDQFLTTRDLDALLHNGSILAQLSTTCILCATVHAPPELCLHLREAHGCNTMLVSFFCAAIDSTVEDMPCGRSCLLRMQPDFQLAHAFTDL